MGNLPQATFAVTPTSKSGALGCTERTIDPTSPEDRQ